MKQITILGFPLLVLATACTQSEVELNTDSQGLKQAMVSVASFITSSDTRLTYHRLDSVTWDEESYDDDWNLIPADTLGVFPVSTTEAASQVYMVYTSNCYQTAEGDNKELYLFYSYAWTFNPAQAYKAYYPLDNRMAASYHDVQFSYDSIQTVDTAHVLANLGDYDRLVSEADQPTSLNGGYTINFVMNHLATLCALNIPFDGLSSQQLHIYLTDSEGGADGCGFPSQLSYNLETETFNEQEIELVTDYYLLAGDDQAFTEETSTLYLMLPPTGVQGSRMVVEMLDTPSEVLYEATLPETLLSDGQGKLYTLTFTAVE